MTTLAITDQPRRHALRACVAALRRVAGYVLDPAIDLRMQLLGERKDALSPEDHAELMALVAFSEQRAIEKLEAELVLRRIEEAFPDLNGEP